MTTSNPTPEELELLRQANEKLRKRRQALVRVDATPVHVEVIGSVEGMPGFLVVRSLEEHRPLVSKGDQLTVFRTRVIAFFKEASNAG